MKQVLQAAGYEIAVTANPNYGDYLSLTDIARFKTRENRGYVIQNWMRTRNTIRFLALWENFHNADFNCLEFEAIEREAGLNSFVLTPKRWIEQTGAVGMQTKQGRYAATFAHQDIAFEFASWVSPEFKLYIITEFQRLKAEEQRQFGWSARRELTKLNYRIHTDAIKQKLIPVELTPKQVSLVYADEADVLNMAMFGMTARQWRDANPGKQGNIRDYASINELICLANLESLNAVMIDEGISQSQRLYKLNKTAIHQMQVLEEVHSHNLLTDTNNTCEN